MSMSWVFNGVMKDRHTVLLDEEVPAGVTKVRVVVKQVAEPLPKRPFEEVLEEIRERQKARGHRPPTAEEVDSYLREERESWGD